MPASLHIQLRAAVAALLAGIGAEAIFQNREFTLSNGKYSQVHVNLRSTRPEDQVIFTSHPRDWATELEVVILTRKNGSVEASDAADSLWVAAYQALMADQTIGGRAWDLLPGEAEFEDAEGDTSLCRLTWLLTVHHRTSNNTLT